MINTSIALLDGPDAYAMHLNDALAQTSENPAEFVTALRTVIQARGTADLAAAVGMGYADIVRQLGSGPTRSEGACAEGAASSPLTA